MQIAILIFEHLTALDAVAPYEALSGLPGARVTFVGEPGTPTARIGADAAPQSPQPALLFARTVNA